MTVRLIAIGNPCRRDDGAALLAAQALRKRIGSDVDIVEISGEPTALLSALEGAGAVVLLDASAAAGAPGRVRRLVPGEDRLAPEAPVASSHAFGLAQTLALAEALGALPPSIVIFAIEGEDFDHGEGLTPRVAAALPALVENVEREIGRLQKESSVHA